MFQYNLTMIILGAIWMGFLLGMGGQSLRLKHECKNGQEYACKADKKLHEPLIEIKKD